MPTRLKTRLSPSIKALAKIESQIERVATALERIATIASRSTGEVFGEPNERFVRVVASVEE